MIRCRHGYPLRLGSGEEVSCFVCEEPGRTAIRKRNQRQSRKWLPSAFGLKNLDDPKIERGQAQGCLREP